MDRRQFVEAMMLAGGAQLTGHRRRIVSLDPPVTPQDIFNVRRFGARGDDRTDDSRAFAEAIGAAASAGGVVAVPAGTYRNSLMLALPTGVSIRGERGSVVHHVEGDPIVFGVSSAHDVEVSDLSIVGSFAHGLVVERASSVRMVRCVTRGATLRRYGYSSGVLIVASRDVTIMENTFIENGGDAPGQGSDIQCEGLGQRSHDLRIINNRCLSSEAAVNILCYDVSNTEIRGNEVRGARMRGASNHGYGILVYRTASNPERCTGNAIVGNHVSHTDGSGIYLARCERSVVDSNIIDDVARIQEDQTLPVAAIALNQSTDSLIIRNRISGSGRKGIAIASNVSGVGHIDIRDNTIARVTGYGIHLRGILTTVEVTGNTLSDVGGGIGTDTPEPQDEIKVTNNEIMRVSNGPGISLRNASRSEVNLNRLRDCSHLALDVTFRDLSSTADGNTVDDSGLDGIRKGDAVRITRPRVP